MILSQMNKFLIVPAFLLFPYLIIIEGQQKKQKTLRLIYLALLNSSKPSNILQGRIVGEICSGGAGGG